MSSVNFRYDYNAIGSVSGVLAYQHRLVTKVNSKDGLTHGPDCIVELSDEAIAASRSYKDNYDNSQGRN